MMQIIHALNNLAIYMETVFVKDLNSTPIYTLIIKRDEGPETHTYSDISECESLLEKVMPSRVLNHIIKQYDGDRLVYLEVHWR